ncbi:MAG TPA: barstar family protein [Syntrophomonadaceae bacterium]|nr:barstar family protein [Syntrophomonadaceae bacterium]HRX20894.1 barstar family protein [Syntrophomonadaceae bacterium]
MDMIILNGKRMTSVGSTHRYLRKKLNFPDYYGGNLDALWDMLTTLSDPVSIKLVETEAMQSYLGEYADSILHVFMEAAEENEQLIFECS